MKRWCILLAVWTLLSVVSSTTAWGALSDYVFSTSTTTYTALTGATTVIYSNGTSGVYNETAVGGAYNIGFNFVFDGTTFTQFTVNTGGLMTLGSTTTSSYNNFLETPPVSNPIIAPFWDHLHMYDGAATCTPVVDVHVSYQLSGSAPNRVLTVEWHTQVYNDGNSTYYYAGNCLPFTTFQVRLYEGTNEITFTYGDFRQGSTAGIAETASIGIAWGSNNFISVTPGSPVTTSTTTANNRIDNYQLTSSTLIPSGTVYTFGPCGMRVTGRTGTTDGGTSGMRGGDTLFSAFSVQRGNGATYTPFTLSMPAGNCPSGSYHIAINGSTEYYFGTPGTYTRTGSLASGSSTIPAITFRPSGTGKRVATLTITDQNSGAIRTYYLGATGTTRIQWQGNLAQGGTAALAHGDTLLKNINVNRRSSRNFNPLTLLNFNLDPTQAPPASVTYTINDPTGQYTITPPSATLGANQSSTPTLTFAPTGAGSQPAILTVTADGETRSFVLYAFSAAPGVEFNLNGVKLAPGIGTFINHTSCVGDVASTHAITVTNVGVGDVTIDAIDFFLTDTTYQQGTPGYPLIRDNAGNPIPSGDYFISTQPGVAPFPANPKVTLPILVPDKGSRTIYITFIGSYPGKRFARAYIMTNGQNFLGTDADGNLVEGLLNFDLFARATGSALSDNSLGGLPKAVVFPIETRAGDSSSVTFSLFNTGVCDLRISKNHFRIFSGDVNEFSLVMDSTLVGVPINGNDYILGPGMSATITARFKPSRSGTRRATLWLRTNDSAIFVPGVSKRGDYMLDLWGTGKAGLDVADVRFPDAIIDAEAGAADAVLTNSSRVVLEITRLRIIGLDSAEFTEDASKSWPTLPKRLLPGEELRLAMLHTAATGSLPGGRQAKLEITLSNGEVIIIELGGTAQTRMITVTPTTLFEGKVIGLGSLHREVIEIKNTGTSVLTLQPPMPGGTDAGEFQIGVLPRLMLSPGQIEKLEVVYAPTRQGTADAQVTIASNATNSAAVVVTLKGEAQKAGRDGEDDRDAVVSRGGQWDVRDIRESTSTVDNTAVAGAMVLRQSVPNPASGVVRIGYRLSERGEVMLRLYDESGREVKVIERGVRGAGDHEVMVNVSDLPSGVYHYRLEAGGNTLSRTLHVTR